jgi:uncharacterized protein YdeI (YjbR/CyaY-like superfamily)
MEPRFFANASEFRAWLEANHATSQELWVGLYKKKSGKPSITWEDVVDQALCFGWIDSVRRSIDDLSYTNRVTPRTPRSPWSTRNINRFEELRSQGLVHPAGIKAFEARTEDNSELYSYEQRDKASLDETAEAQFRANQKAWEFFQAQTPSYRKTAIWWVVSAKKEETRLKRLMTLIDDSENGRIIPPLRRRSG